MQILRAHYRILLILVLALMLRLYHVTYPFLDHHNRRQTDTAAVARNFYRDQFNLLRPEMDRFGSSPAVVELELQITPDQLAAGSIAQFRNQGAKYIVVTDYRTIPDNVKRDIERLERWQRGLILIAHL